MSVEFNGQTIKPEQVLGESRPGIKVCYCTDTRPVKGHAEFVSGADLFVCEGIYAEIDKLDKAIDHRHMIFQEAAQIAKDGKVNELWLTHFSPSLTDPGQYKSEAQSVFPNTVIGRDRMTKTIRFKED